MEGLVRDTLEEYSPASNLLHNEKIREMMDSGQTIYHFGFGQSPFPLMDTAVESLKKHADKSAYLPVIGIKELREAICDFHKRHDDMSLCADDVIVGPGSKELIFLLMTVFKGDIIVISPSWTTYKPQVMLSQHKPYVINTSRDKQWKIDANMFSQFLESNKLSPIKLLILNNPDNPTGACYTQQDLTELSKVFRKHKVIVLSDEIYARLKYDHDHCSMAKVYPEGTILCSGLSKWASAGGWRLGYHIYPKELVELRQAVRSAASHTYTSVAAPIQYASNDFLRDVDGCSQYIHHTNRIMCAVAQYCYRELTSVGVKATPSGGGFYLFPDFEIVREKLKERGITTCEEMVNIIFDETSVSIMAGGPAFLRPVTELTTRLCYVNFDGKVALEESRKIGLDTPLSSTFVIEHCSLVHHGIQALKTWVSKQLV